MKILKTLLVTSVDACFAVITPILIPFVIATTSWAFVDNFYGAFSYRFDAALAIWASSLGVPVTVLQPIDFSVSITPLGMTLVTVLISLRLAKRCAVVGRKALQLLIASVAYTITAITVLSFSRWEIFVVDSTQIVVSGVFIYISCAFIATWVWTQQATTKFLRSSETATNPEIFTHPPTGNITSLRGAPPATDQTRMLSPPIGTLTINTTTRAERFQIPKWLRVTVRLAFRCAGILLCLQIGLSALLFAGLQLFHAFDMVQIYNSMNAGIVGLIIILLIQLAFFPNVLIWILSWQLGTGFHIGGAGLIGSGSDPSLPLLPFFAALPRQNFPLLVGILLSIFAALPAGVWLMKSRSIPFGFGWKLLVGVLGTVGAGFGFVALGYLGGGSIGPSRAVWVNPFPLFLLGTADIMCGMLLGVLTGIALRPHISREIIATPHIAQALRRVPLQIANIFALSLRFACLSLRKSGRDNVAQGPRKTRRMPIMQGMNTQHMQRRVKSKTNKDTPGLGVPRMKDLE